MLTAHSLQGDIYIADLLHHRVRKITVSTSIISTIAGTGTASFSGDNGPATSAGINAPIGIDFDTSGNPSIAVTARIHHSLVSFLKVIFTLLIMVTTECAR